MSSATRALLVVALACAHAAAQPELDAPPPSPDQSTTQEGIEGTTIVPERFDPSRCMARTKPDAEPEPANVAPPVTWSGFDIEGQLADERTTVRALFEPTMSRHRALTSAAREDVRAIAGAFGYHLVGLTPREVPGNGTVAIIHLAPLPMLRRVDVDVDQSLFDTLLDDEIRRRMRIRTGGYLPWTPLDRQCLLYEEKLRIEEFLRDEGYFEGTVAIAETRKGRGISLDVEVELEEPYTTGRVNIAEREPNNVTDGEITQLFRHKKCVVPNFGCFFGEARFTREQHQKDIQKVVELFHKRGYPAVRVRTDFDPRTSFNRRTNLVDFTVTIDQRRQLEVVFEGQSDAISVEDLRKQLTFNAAASSDDVEASESARAITAYLQSRGYFDAKVTWIRERFERFDRIIYRIEQGRLRQVATVDFAGNYALTDGALADVIATGTASATTSLFGGSSATTSAQLSADVDRIVEAYRREGYRDVRVRVTAATSEAALGSAALTAALVAADVGDDLHVRFTITEGLPTLLTQVHVDVGGGKGTELRTDDERLLCRIALEELADFHAEPQLATPADPKRCVGVAANLRFREGDATPSRDRLRDRLFSAARPRATVAYEARELGPHRVAVFYTLGDVQALRIGQVVIRGNFRTSGTIIRDQLGLAQGAPLTKDALAEGARKLRNTGLFDAVNVALPDLENISGGEVNAVVEVAERYDYRAQVAAETGYSSFNGLFVKLIPSIKNLWGQGISLDLAGTVGLGVGELIEGDARLRQLSAEATLRLPPYFVGQKLGIPENLRFQTELTAFRRQQDTPRFGILTTDGATLALSRTWQRPRIGTRPANARTLGFNYDFRRRERLVDVLRPVGADDNETQVPISTRTGQIALIGEWEQRVDRNGTLSPLAPESGFRLEGRVAWAAPWFGGQNHFLKVSGSVTKYWAIGNALVLRVDGRYDHGFPFGEVVLPEVERFFAGGDTTVRGYEDDRLKTEIIRVSVPPFDNTQQIRVLPSGGNIRAMSSIDAQVRVWKVLATAVFVDAGLITNQWTTVTEDDIRPAVGVALIRIVTPFGVGALERAMPLRPQLGDNPRGRWHLSFAARAQF